jgi:nitrate reductase gamma subunit
MQLASQVSQLPYLLCYLALVSFAVTVLARFAMWAKLPMHMRWELYPVPHAPAGKSRYGGSFMEEADWWKQPRKTSPLGAVRATLPEVLLLSSVREHNRQLWARTFPFHLGLYLAGGAAGLALLAGLARALAPQLLAGSPGDVAHELVLVLGVAGLALGCLGALSLLHRRLTLPALRAHTVPADIFNLVFFIVTFACCLLTFGLVDRHADLAMAFAANLAAFNLASLPGTGIDWLLPVATVVLSSSLVAYIPLTHMSHFVGKYFAYHAIRWNDQPNLAGGPQEAKIAKLLAYKVSWDAEHIRGAGKKTWADLAMENPTEIRK